MKKNWMDTPWTWRSYFKLTGIAVAFSLLMNMVWWIIFFRDEISDWFTEKFGWLRKKKYVED